VLDELTRTIIELRLGKAEKCLKASELLLNAESYADSVNRSYYCIYHAMHAVLTTIGFSSSKHSGNISEFRRVFVKTGVFADTYSDIVGSAFKVRTKSDYDIHYVVSKSEVITQLESARDFLSAVEVYIDTLSAKLEKEGEQAPNTEGDCQ